MHYDPKTEIMATVGASEGIDLALRAIVEPGDEVIVPDPSYVSYMPGVAFANGVCVPAPTYMEDQFRLTPQAPIGRDAENPSVYHHVRRHPFSARGGGGPAHRFRQ